MAGAGAAHADPYAARLADSSIGAHTMAFLQSVSGVKRWWMVSDVWD
jgi:hypothetical protein